MKQRSKSVIFTVIVGSLLAMGVWAILAQQGTAQASKAFSDQRDSLSAGVAWLIEENQNQDGR